jgi:glycosyltransferase 2 family protein
VRLGFLGTLFNLFLPGAVGGDLFKAVIAAKQAPGKRPEVVASMLVDRALGLLGLLLVAATSLLLFGDGLSLKLEWIRRGAWLLVAVGVTALSAVVFVGHRLPVHWLQRIPVIGKLAYRMASAGMLFEGRPGLVLQLLGMSCTVHALLTFGIFVIAQSLYSSPPGIREHFLVVPPAFAAATLPISPGGVGVQEVLIDTLFKELPNIASEFSGLIVAFAYRAELIAMAAIGGLFYIFASKEEKDLATRAEEEVAMGGE